MKRASHTTYCSQAGHVCAMVYARQEGLGKESNELPTVGKHDHPFSPIVRETRHGKFM